MLKSEVVKKEGKTADVNVIIEGTSDELLAEISSILESFDKRPELTRILIIAMDKLIKKAKDKLIKKAKEDI
jgi:hypothetical protein